jgi:hypothetical protein
MTTNGFITLYLSTIGIIGGLSAFVINHLLGEIKMLHKRVDDIYTLLLERQ